MGNTISIAIPASAGACGHIPVCMPPLNVGCLRTITAVCQFMRASKKIIPTMSLFGIKFVFLQPKSTSKRNMDDYHAENKNSV